MSRKCSFVSKESAPAAKWEVWEEFSCDESREGQITTMKHNAMSLGQATLQITGDGADKMRKQLSSSYTLSLQTLSYITR